MADRAKCMAAGRVAWNRGEPFVAHELWEDVWRSAAGADRRWLQGLIQVAAGLHQLGHGRPRPAVTLLERALTKLADAPAVLDGVDVAVVRKGAARLLDAIRRGEPTDPAWLRLP